ncbi:hypothetical protein [Rhodopseudomonas sp. B29]|nr:hypothetical protein [Rhodopseudomonas sp. B29]
MTTIATIGISAKAWDKHIASAAIDALAQRLNGIANNRSQQPDAEFLLYYADTATAVARRYD